MPRYIDVESLGIRRANSKVFENMAYADGWNAAIDIITSAPTADVQEVKHGYWIAKELDNFRKVECSCSICGWSGVENYDSYVDIHDFEFCPNCGAKMDSEDNQ